MTSPDLHRIFPRNPDNDPDPVNQKKNPGTLTEKYTPHPPTENTLREMCDLYWAWRDLEG